MKKQSGIISNDNPLTNALVDGNAALAEINLWIDEDLAKSGLTRNDIELVPFEPQSQNGNAKNNGGYGVNCWRSLKCQKMN